jgi:hypothetical protein
VPVDASVGLQLWMGLTSDLMEALGGGEVGEAAMREQLEQVFRFARHMAGQIDALDRGASAAVVTHPPDCQCEHCQGGAP